MERLRTAPARGVTLIPSAMLTNARAICGIVASRNRGTGVCMQHSRASRRRGRTTMLNPSRVFVSHHHSQPEDDFTARLVYDLRQAGATVWVDVADVRDGDFIERINAALASSDWVVMVLTPAALRSQPMRTEINAALNLVWQGRIRGVIPIVAENVEPAEIPPTWTTLQRYDATRDYMSALAGLLGALGLSVLTSGQPVPPTYPAFPGPTLPPLGPAPAPVNAVPLPQLVPPSLYDLGYRGYEVKGVEYILPPICPVPGGAFTMGSNKTLDPNAEDRETPRRLEQVAAFAIAQYPVTVAEYACAVRAKARRAPAIYETDWQVQLAHMDHPVVLVNFDEAALYIYWLADITKQSWRKLTEVQWEKAARGTDGRIYPWGDAFDESKCNASESGIKATTPVGRYPDGASPYGVQDMAGNVWEWVGDSIRTDQKDGAGNVVYNGAVRGGSWRNLGKYARAAYRMEHWHVTVERDLGFRMAWLMPRS